MRGSDKTWTMFQNGSEQAMKEIFFEYSQMLYRKALSIVRHPEIAKDMVQEVMIDLWIKKQGIDLNGSLGPYLHKCIANRSLNHIRDNKPELFDDFEVEGLGLKEDEQIHSTLFAVDLEGSVDQIIDTLPEKCRVIFLLSRFDGLTYKEIASKLDISVKTVEGQVSKALKRIRLHLKNHCDIQMI